MADWLDELDSSFETTAAPPAGEAGGSFLDDVDQSFSQAATEPAQPPIQPAAVPEPEEFVPRAPGSRGVELGLARPSASTMDSEQGRWSSAGGSFMRGFGSIIASLPKAVGEGAVAIANRYGDDPIWGNPENLTPEDTASYKAGNTIERWFNKFAVNPEYKDEFLASKLPEGAGSMAGFMSGGIAGRAAGIPALVSTMGLGATATGVEGVDDYLGSIAMDKKADPKMRENAFLLNGALGTSEGLPISRLLDRLDTYTGGGVKKIIKEGFKGGVEELTQEVLQTVGQNAIASEILQYDKDRNLFAGAVEAGEVGFTLGFAMNTLAAMIGARRSGGAGQADTTQEPGVDEPALPGEEAGPPPIDARDVLGDVQESADTDADVAADITRFNEVPIEDLPAGPAETVPTVTYFDPRLKRENFRGELEAMANDLVPGGGIELVPDPNYIPASSDVRGDDGQPLAPLIRTPSLNPSWFQGMVSSPDTQVSVEGAREAVRKAIAGERLGVRQARVVGAMLDEYQGARTSQPNLDYARQQLEIARDARFRAGLPRIATDWMFEEQEYPAEADGLTRSFMELHEEARQRGGTVLDQVEALMESQRNDEEILNDITALLKGEQDGRQIQVGAEIDQRQEEPGEIPDTGAVPVTREPAGAPGDLGVEPGIDRGPAGELTEPAPAVETELGFQLTRQTDEELAAAEARAQDKAISDKEQADREVGLYDLQGQVDDTPPAQPTGDMFPVGPEGIDFPGKGMSYQEKLDAGLVDADITRFDKAHKRADALGTEQAEDLRALFEDGDIDIAQFEERLSKLEGEVGKKAKESKKEKPAKATVDDRYDAAYPTLPLNDKTRDLLRKGYSDGAQAIGDSKDGLFPYEAGYWLGEMDARSGNVDMDMLIAKEEEKGPADVINTASGRPFKKWGAAQAHITRRKLEKTHEVTEVEGGFSVTKKAKKEDAAAIPTKEFKPTHELADGTPVIAADEDNVWLDAEGVEFEEDGVERIAPAVKAPAKKKHPGKREKREVKQPSYETLPVSGIDQRVELGVGDRFRKGLIAFEIVGFNPPISDGTPAYVSVRRVAMKAKGEWTDDKGSQGKPRLFSFGEFMRLYNQDLKPDFEQKLEKQQKKLPAMKYIGKKLENAEQQGVFNNLVQRRKNLAKLLDCINR